jgi:hypothetical protein
MPQAYTVCRTGNSHATNPLLGVPPFLQCTFLLWLHPPHSSPILSGTWPIKGLLSFQWLVLGVPHPALCAHTEGLAARKSCDYLPASAEGQKWCTYIWHYFLFHWIMWMHPTGNHEPWIITSPILLPLIYLLVKWWPVLYLFPLHSPCFFLHFFSGSSL